MRGESGLKPLSATQPPHCTAAMAIRWPNSARAPAPQTARITAVRKPAAAAAALIAAMVGNRFSRSVRAVGTAASAESKGTTARAASKGPSVLRSKAQD